ATRSLHLLPHQSRRPRSFAPRLARKQRPYRLNPSLSAQVEPELLTTRSSTAVDSRYRHYHTVARSCLQLSALAARIRRGQPTVRAQRTTGLPTHLLLARDRLGCEKSSQRAARDARRTAQKKRQTAHRRTWATAA